MMTLCIFLLDAHAGKPCNKPVEQPCLKFCDVHHRVVEPMYQRYKALDVSTHLVPVPDGFISFPDTKLQAMRKWLTRLYVRASTAIEKREWFTDKYVAPIYRDEGHASFVAQIKQTKQHCWDILATIGSTLVSRSRPQGRSRDIDVDGSTSTSIEHQTAVFPPQQKTVDNRKFETKREVDRRWERELEKELDEMVKVSKQARSKLICASSDMYEWIHQHYIDVLQEVVEHCPLSSVRSESYDPYEILEKQYMGEFANLLVASLKPSTSLYQISKEYQRYISSCSRTRLTLISFCDFLVSHGTDANEVRVLHGLVFTRRDVLMTKIVQSARLMSEQSCSHSLQHPAAVRNRFVSEQAHQHMLTGNTLSTNPVPDKEWTLDATCSYWLYDAPVSSKLQSVIASVIKMTNAQVQKLLPELIHGLNQDDMVLLSMAIKGRELLQDHVEQLSYMKLGRDSKVAIAVKAIRCCRMCGLVDIQQHTQCPKCGSVYCPACLSSDVETLSRLATHGCIAICSELQLERQLVLQQYLKPAAAAAAVSAPPGHAGSGSSS